jgi:hypothetical protein
MYQCIMIRFDLIWFLVFNTTFSNFSAISWWPVLVVYLQRTTDHGQATGKLYHLLLRVECTLFCKLQSWARTHAVLVICLYELLGNPTTKLIEPPGPFSVLWIRYIMSYNLNEIYDQFGLMILWKLKDDDFDTASFFS